MGDVREVIDDGKTRFLVDPNNIEAVVEGIGELLKNKSLAKSLGRAGRRKVERVFSGKFMAQKTLELL